MKLSITRITSESDTMNVERVEAFSITRITSESESMNEKRVEAPSQIFMSSRCPPSSQTCQMHTALGEDGVQVAGRHAAELRKAGGQSVEQSGGV